MEDKKLEMETEGDDMKNKLDIGSMIAGVINWRVFFVYIYTSHCMYMGISFVPTFKWRK